MRRIGIFGGTFDPPHPGHLGIASTVVTSGEVDEVWMMVSPRNPFKKDKEISGEKERLEMVRIAVAELPANIRNKIKVSDFETRLPQPTYTIITLRKLKELYPYCAFRLIIGGDNLSAFSKWREPEEILRDFGLIVYPRPGDSDWNTSELPQECVIIENVPLFPYSSTEIRRIAREEPSSLSNIVSEELADYILKHRLYEK